MIKLTAPNTYTATISGTEWSGVTPASRFWDDVQALIAGGEAIEDMTGPQPVPVPQSMTFAQLLIGLVAEGWTTEAEGDAWLAGTIPAAASQLIATLPVNQRFAAKARAARPSTVLRNDPLVNALAEMQGKTQADMDAFFTAYAAV